MSTPTCRTIASNTDLAQALATLVAGHTTDSTSTADEPRWWLRTIAADRGPRLLVHSFGSSRSPDDHAALDALLDAGPDWHPELPDDASIDWRRADLLGPASLLDDRTYVEHTLDCLIFGTRVALAALAAHDTLDFQARRHVALTRLLGPALKGWPADRRHRQLLYQRDTILRHLLLRVGRDRDGGERWIGRFDEMAARLETPARAAFAALLDDHHPSSDLLATAGIAWRRALGRWSEHLEAMESTGVADIDPFTHGLVGPCLAKLIDTLARGLGIRPLDEAYLLHVLIVCTQPAAAASGPNALPWIPALSDRSATHPSAVQRALRDDFRWLDFVEAHGDASRDWADIYRSRTADVRASTDLALHSLRRGDLTSGRAQLRAATSTLASLPPEPRSILDVLGRHVHGAVAYELYCRGRFDDAIREMDRMGRSLVAAIDAEAWLLPAALMLPDVDLQKARIARRRGRWSVLEEHVRRLADQAADRVPLCVGQRGPIYFSTVTDHLLQLDLTTAERQTAQALADRERRCEEIDAYIRPLYLFDHQVAA
ncbi:MAG: hypothetical protein AAGE94_10750 [Acidobacteriota bacterium]